MIRVLVLRTRLAGRLVQSQRFRMPCIVRMGRDPGCDVHLPDPFVSRMHARIHGSKKGIFLTDNRSSNGVQVNGASVDHVLLSNGDRIRIGGFDVELTLAGEDELIESLPTERNDLI
jgi:pSer/pThr/pTyr-binding forkhead associated (FHA) protein